MKRSELGHVLSLLDSLYGTKFPPLTEGMGKLWFERLEPCDGLLMIRAVKRFAAQRYNTTIPPTLDDLVDIAEHLAQEDARAGLPPRQRHQPQSAQELLEMAAQGAQQRSDADGFYAHAMVELFEGMAAHRLTRRACAAQCRAWAVAYAARWPPLVTDFRKAARQYDTFADALKEPRTPDAEPCQHEHRNALGRCAACGLHQSATLPTSRSETSPPCSSCFTVPRGKPSPLKAGRESELS